MKRRSQAVGVVSGPTQNAETAICEFCYKQLGPAYFTKRIRGKHRNFCDENCKTEFVSRGFMQSVVLRVGPENSAAILGIVPTAEVQDFLNSLVSLPCVGLIFIVQVDDVEQIPTDVTLTLDGYRVIVTYRREQLGLTLYINPRDFHASVEWLLVSVRDAIKGWIRKLTSATAAPRVQPVNRPLTEDLMSQKVRHLDDWEVEARLWADWLAQQAGVERVFDSVPTRHGKDFRGRPPTIIDGGSGMLHAEFSGLDCNLRNKLKLKPSVDRHGVRRVLVAVIPTRPWLQTGSPPEAASPKPQAPNHPVPPADLPLPEWAREGSKAFVRRLNAVFGIREITESRPSPNEHALASWAPRINVSDTGIEVTRYGLGTSTTYVITPDDVVFLHDIADTFRRMLVFSSRDESAQAAAVIEAAKPTEEVKGESVATTSVEAPSTSPQEVMGLIVLSPRNHESYWWLRNRLEYADPAMTGWVSTNDCPALLRGHFGTADGNSRSTDLAQLGILRIQSRQLALIPTRPAPEGTNAKRRNIPEILKTLPILEDRSAVTIKAEVTQPIVLDDNAGSAASAYVSVSTNGSDEAAIREVVDTCPTETRVAAMHHGSSVDSEIHVVFVSEGHQSSKDELRVVGERPTNGYGDSTLLTGPQPTSDELTRSTDVIGEMLDGVYRGRPPEPTTLSDAPISAGIPSSCEVHAEALEAASEASDTGLLPSSSEVSGPTTVEEVVGQLERCVLRLQELGFTTIVTSEGELHLSRKLRIT